MTRQSRITVKTNGALVTFEIGSNAVKLIVYEPIKLKSFELILMAYA